MEKRGRVGGERRDDGCGNMKLGKNMRKDWQKKGENVNSESKSNAPTFWIPKVTDMIQCHTCPFRSPRQSLRPIHWTTNTVVCVRVCSDTTA